MQSISQPFPFSRLLNALAMTAVGLSVGAALMAVGLSEIPRYGRLTAQGVLEISAGAGLFGGLGTMGFLGTLNTLTGYFQHKPTFKSGHTHPRV
jgi:hypothetical protein